MKPTHVFQRKHVKPATGFTLIELVTALAVAGILVGLALPSMQNFVLQQRVKTTSFDIFTTLNFARSEAIKRNANVTITPTSSGWTITDSGGNTLRQFTQPSGLAITGPSSIVFRKDGHLSGATSSVTITVNVSPANPNVTARCIGIDLSGRPYSRTGSSCR